MSEKSPAYVLELLDLVRSYGEAVNEVTVLTGANLAIESGEMVALVAPSGTGKSTLLHAAGLLERPDSGEVVVCGHSTSALEDRRRTELRRSAIGFVYQFHHLLPEFSALENLTIPQLVHGTSKDVAIQRAQELLDYLKIGNRASHRPSELSGGEQQRVAIARAVANRPRLLLADEPTGNLDPDTSSHVFSSLKELVRQTGLAALIATHNHSLAQKMDRCVTLSSGKIEPLKL